MTKDTHLINEVLELNETEVLMIVQQRLQDGDDPLAIVEDCQEGMRRVGERYEQGQYFLSGLIMAGEIFREVMELAQPVIKKKVRGNESGRILLGTVQGDIHDIGKNIQTMLLSCYGFTVYDLGVDVPPDVFVTEAVKVNPDLVGLSGLLTSSYDTMRDTVTLFRRNPDHPVGQIPIIIGGGTINDQVCEYVGADYWIVNAMDGVRLCQRLLAVQSVE
ncbi:MAG: cobalamin-dependent protein [Anaerolineae bacterium]|nr:cobalamin-dependent protein [Anaerolineae bacterium]